MLSLVVKSLRQSWLPRSLARWRTQVLSENASSTYELADPSMMASLLESSFRRDFDKDLFWVRSQSPVSAKSTVQQHRLCLLHHDDSLRM